MFPGMCEWVEEVWAEKERGGVWGGGRVWRPWEFIVWQRAVFCYLETLGIFIPRFVAGGLPPGSGVTVRDWVVTLWELQQGGVFVHVSAPCHFILVSVVIWAQLWECGRPRYWIWLLRKAHVWDLGVLVSGVEGPYRKVEGKVLKSCTCFFVFSFSAQKASFWDKLSKVGSQVKDCQE